MPEIGNIFNSTNFHHSLFINLLANIQNPIILFVIVTNKCLWIKWSVFVWLFWFHGFSEWEHYKHFGKIGFLNGKEQMKRKTCNLMLRFCYDPTDLLLGSWKLSRIQHFFRLSFLPRLNTVYRFIVYCKFVIVCNDCSRKNWVKCDCINFCFE